MMKYTDAHCHIISQTCDSNIIARISNATTEDDWQKLVAIANKQNHVCIGIHPWYIHTATPGWDNRMRKILQKNPNIMIGETGLDKHYPNIEAQIDLFVTQLEIATEFNRPIHIHVTGAWDKILNILKKYKKLPTIIAHSFSGNIDIITKLVNRYDIYFSYAEKQFKNNTKNKTLNCVSATPRNKLLIESDSNSAESELKLLQTVCDFIAPKLQCPAYELFENTAKNLLNIL